VDTAKYLERIEFRGRPETTTRTLRSLQHLHLLHVPFENLDIHLGVPIVLDIDRFYQKIVINRRGGFCYELNGLFYSLLVALGFDARMISGRVYDSSNGTYGSDFDHMAALVEIDGDKWIADVGFGDFSMHPLRFVVNTPLMDSTGQFQIEEHDEGHFRISRYSEMQRVYVPEYVFSTQERHLNDFGEACRYQQTSPASHFTKKMMCSIATPTGRITLTNDTLIITERGNRTEEPIKDRREFDLTLKRYFSISLW
jgi:N-hydroxyarylamine O-acetyltransferase